MKLRIPWFVRLLVSAAVLAYLLTQAPLSSLGQAFRSVPPSLGLAVLAAFLVGHVVSAYKWWGLTTLFAAIPRHLALRAHFTGLVGNLCLPGVAGGDLVRAACVMHKPEGRGGILLACAADRLIDCCALLLLSLAGALWMVQVSDWLRHTILITGGFAVLALIIVLVASRARSEESQGRLRRLVNSLALLVRNPWILLRTLVLALLVQGSFVMLNGLLGSAAGVEVSFAAWFFAWPLAKLVATLPVSLGGLGVREATLVVLLQPVGGDPAAVTCAGLLWYGVLVAGGLIGGLAVLAPTQWGRASLEKAACGE